MPTLYEIFSYPISDQSEAAKESRRTAHCAFMDTECDGGGNRDLSTITLKPDTELKLFFPDRKQVCAGVCSIQMTPRGTPWIVCPRRLLALNRSNPDSSVQKKSAEQVFRHLQYPAGTKLGIWSEVRVMERRHIDGVEKKFNAAFDYIVMPLDRFSGEELSEIVGKSWNTLKRDLSKVGYTLSLREGKDYVEDFPSGAPSIIEIMTSSTSGGNKKDRSQIPMAFEDAMLGKPHKAPGINFRQVWARMASQLIMKSEVGIGWGGKTIWLMQDHLLDYISSSTALKLREFAADHTSEVNLLSFAYQGNFLEAVGVRELMANDLYAGPISRTQSPLDETHSFQDILKAPILPSRQQLLRLLSNRKKTMVVQV